MAMTKQELLDAFSHANWVYGNCELQRRLCEAFRNYAQSALDNSANTTGTDQELIDGQRAAAVKKLAEVTTALAEATTTLHGFHSGITLGINLTNDDRLTEAESQLDITKGGIKDAINKITALVTLCYLLEVLCRSLMRTLGVPWMPPSLPVDTGVTFPPTPGP